MAVLFKAVAKGQPGVVGGGTIKYYAGIVRQQPVELRKFASEISTMCTLTTTDVYAVLEAFIERMHNYMEEGRIIRLGDFGSFSPSILSSSEDAPTDVDQYTINRMKMNFRPGRELSYRLTNVKFLKTGTATDSSEIVE